MRVYAMDKKTMSKRDETHASDHQESQDKLLRGAYQISLDEQEHQDRSGEQESNVMHKEDGTKKDINHIQFHR